MRKAGLALVALAAIAAGWTALWFFAASAAGRQADAWIAAEARQGRTWTCPHRAIGGYPLAIAIACDDATFVGKAMDQSVEVSAAHLVAEASLLHPRSIVATLTGPLSYKTSDGTTDLAARWTRLTLDLGTLPAIDTVALHGSDVSVEGTFGAQGRQSGSAARLDTRLTLPQGAETTLDFAIDVGGTPIAALDALVGGEAPADIAVAGHLDHTDAVGDARTPEEAIERWREAGGRVALDPSRVTRGDAKLIASGVLALDGAHRPQGKLDAQFVGLEPILARYGISGNMAAAGSLLSSLLGGAAAPTTPREPGALALPISMRNGHLGVGPIQTDVALPPLY